VILTRLLRDAVDLIYPPRCVCCRQTALQDHTAFCSGCRSDLDELAATAACDRCAVPLPAGAACPFCQGRGLHPFDQIVALGPFRDPLRSLIHQMKYHHRWPLAEILADRLLDEPRVARLLDQTDVLVPVPLYWRRQIARGYNQADALARRLARRRGIPLVHPIIRLKNTPPQTAIHARAQREQNLRNAFGLVDGKPICGKRLTLVDDVMTTAATLKSAARALEDARPAAISALVLAVADPRRHDFQAI
jgi:ComF family protein